MKFRKSDAIRVFASGGMGNQIFQFAFSAFLKQELNLKSEFLNLKVFKRIRHTNFDLIPFIDDKSFLSSPSSNFLKYFSYAVDPWHSLRMHVVWGQRFDFRFDHAISPDSLPQFNYPGYIVGYFQNYEFVSKVDSIVLQILSKIVKKPTSPMFEDLNYEAIHIRGGDFLRPSNRNTIGSLGRNYYNLLLPKKSSLPRIVITDDIDHAQTLLKKVNIDMYFDSSKLDFRESLFILGNARRIYIANSTYSWLGGFFGNEINDAEVVQPIPFFRSGRLNYGVKLLNPNFQKFPSNWA
jgi:hypothetical protein